jgi:hypothetical protein
LDTENGFRFGRADPQGPFSIGGKGTGKFPRNAKKCKKAKDVAGNVLLAFL